MSMRGRNGVLKEVFKKNTLKEERRQGVPKGNLSSKNPKSMSDGSIGSPRLRKPSGGKGEGGATLEKERIRGSEVGSVSAGASFYSRGEGGNGNGPVIVTRWRATDLQDTPPPRITSLTKD